jgi:hypothetical protein
VSVDMVRSVDVSEAVGNEIVAMKNAISD